MLGARPASSKGKERGTVETVVAGVDVGKAELHACVEGEERTVANAPAGFRALRKWFSKRGVARAILEPTGRYRRRLRPSLATAGFEAVVADPLRSRRFAEALGALAKTDRIDAAMLARFGAAMPQLEAVAPREGVEEALEDLLASRSALVETCSRMELTASQMNDVAAAPLREVQASAKQRIARLDRSIAALVQSDEDWARRYAILLSIPGIGPVNAAMLLCWMPELGALRGRQAASLLGVAPFAADSGKSRGARHIRGGRRRPRTGLYRAARTAAVRNPDLKLVFDRLKAAGKAHKVAIVAVMRKLVLLANALLRDDRRWTPEAPRSA